MAAGQNTRATGTSRLHRARDAAFAALDGVTRLAFWASAVLLAVITALYCMEIVLRYFFLAPTLWSRDTITYLLCATLMLAAPQVARNNTHVAITIAVEGLPDRIRAAVERLLALVTGIVSGGVAWITAQETLRLISSNILTLGTIAVPKWWISIFIPVGFALIALQFLSHAADGTRLGHDKTQV